MIRQMRIKTLITFCMLFTVIFLLISCGPKPRIPVSQLDTPEHHTYAGLRLFDQAKYTDAQREFELAIQLAPKYSKAHTGVALVKTATGDFGAAGDSLKKGWRYARTDDEKLFLYVSRIRYYTASKLEKNWLNLAKDDFDNAVLTDAKHAPAYYFMGLAYKAGLEFDAAGKMFTKVLDLKTDYITEADAQWNLIQKIQRAMPGTINGKIIAIVDRITRADAAALFMEEMKIDVLYKKRTSKTFDTTFKDPEKAAAAAVAPKVTANDIANHPLRSDIEGILEIGVRGLENYPDGNFHPEEIVTRAAYAMMLEDVLIKVTGDNSLATKFIGSTSPFPDVRADLPYFNAIMVVTSRGIMEAKDMTTGEFAPLNSVPGVDALLIIRKIKQELKFN
ncbi:MAG: S-layer homology domain-containing protein [Smithella sp.]